jgi:peroxiredoxin
MCTFRDNLGKLSSANAKIFGVSVDLPFSADAFSKKNELNFPILSDMNREATKAYDVLFPNLANVPGLDVSARAVFLIDADGIIQYVEVTENPGVEPNYDAVMSAAASL